MREDFALLPKLRCYTVVSLHRKSITRDVKGDGDSSQSDFSGDTALFSSSVQHKRLCWSVKTQNKHLASIFHGK